MGNNPASIMARAAMASPESASSFLLPVLEELNLPGLVKFFNAHKHHRAVSGNGQFSLSDNNNGGEMLL
jgi:hypothetical protein